MSLSQFGIFKKQTLRENSTCMPVKDPGREQEKTQGAFRLKFLFEAYGRTEQRRGW